MTRHHICQQVENEKKSLGLNVSNGYQIKTKTIYL
jgi:hypothetical protein